MSNTDTKKVLQNSVSAVMLYCVWPANYSNEDYTSILAHEKIRGRLRIQESETWKVKISWWGENVEWNESLFIVLLWLSEWLLLSVFQGCCRTCYISLLQISEFVFNEQFQQIRFAIFIYNGRPKYVKNQSCHLYFSFWDNVFSPNECPGLYWNIDSRD